MKSHNQPSVFSISAKEKTRIYDECPNCGNRASIPTKIFFYRGASSGWFTFLFGLFGNLFSFMLGMDYLNRETVL